MSADPVIELVHAGICRDAASGPQLRDVSWRVASGEFWVVAGSHGCGKSLLLETMAGIRPCGGGELKWFGQSVNLGDSEEQGRATLRRRIGLTFDGGGRVFTQMTVAENLALPVSYHEACTMEEALERTGPLLSALELDRLAEVPAGRVGRGWMQRVALGRALSLRPEVLLLDSPVAGLDPNHFRWWLEFLAALSAGHPAVGSRPLTLVVTTDDAGPWSGIGRQFAEIGDGTWQPVPGPSDLGPASPPPPPSPPRSPV